VKQFTLHIIYFFLVLSGLSVYAQSKGFKGYRIEGHEIVFAFDKRDYEKASSDSFGLRRDFEDLDIESVVVSGEFNNWSKDKWYMTKIDGNRYELRKKIEDFTDAFSWEFKFVINNAYWAEPSRNDPNISKAIKNGRRIHGIYNLKMYTAYPSETGNAYFKLRGFKDAKKVILAGSFNKWDENLFKMNKTEGGWELTLQMKPDIYQYRFIVDGQWMEDPDNNNKTRNEFREYNSVINIKEYTAFKLKGYTHAKKVILTGSFNNWNENELVMRKMDYGWKYVIPLSGGKHHYKFIVDGEWIVDPNNSIKEYDGKGHINSVCMVK
tara:strand:+ start:8406 stop:9374 length:969 start_codon:yes stop_codon:yes gene_type:complete